MIRDDELVTGGCFAEATFNASSLFREPAEEFGCVNSFTHRIAPCLAVFQRNESRNLLNFSSHDLECLAQDFCPLTRSHASHSAKGIVGSTDRGNTVGNAGISDSGQDLLGCGVHDIESLSAGHPRATNKEVGPHVEACHGASIAARRTTRQPGCFGCNWWVTGESRVHDPGTGTLAGSRTGPCSHPH